MFKPKTPISAVFPGTARQGKCASPKGSIERDGRLDNSSREWIQTTDLRVMSPTSILLICLRRIKKHFFPYRLSQPAD